MRAREFLFEYDRKKTAQVISGGDKAEKALLADRGETSILSAMRAYLLRLQPPRRSLSGPDREKFLEDLLSYIETKDPTTNKQYTPWLARMYINGGVKLEDLNRNNILGIYDIGKRRRMIKPEDNDINRFKTYREFEGTMLTKYDLDNIEGADKKKEEEKGQASKVFENNDVLVVVPHDEAAACRYGRGTRWCTAATSGQNYFDHYNRRGKMYILIPKQPAYEGEKYQLHFPSSQFMNEDDIGVSLTYIFDRFPELKEFFFKNEPEIKNLIEFTPDDILQPLIDKIAAFAEEKVWEVISEWEQYDDYYYQQMREKYSDEEGDIDWDKVHEGGDDYLRWNDDARRFEIDMNHSLRPQASNLKRCIATDWDGHENSRLDLSILPEIIADRVREDFPTRRGGRDAHGIPAFIDRRVFIKRVGSHWDVELLADSHRL